MKNYLVTSIKLTITMLVVCCVIYFGIVTVVGKLAKGNGSGEKVMVDGKLVGYELLGQKFTDDKYFWGRPSAVDYNAAGSAGSNKAPSNPEYLKSVRDSVDSFLVHNPGIAKQEIPSELVTASGSGLDPDISPAGAAVQVKRIAAVRKINASALETLIDEHTERPIFGPSVVQVLRLNIALDELSAKSLNHQP